MKQFAVYALLLSVILNLKVINIPLVYVYIPTTQIWPHLYNQIRFLPDFNPKCGKYFNVNTWKIKINPSTLQKPKPD